MIKKRNNIKNKLLAKKNEKLLKEIAYNKQKRWQQNNHK